LRPENLRRHVQRIAAAQGIKKKVGWHTFRRTLSTLLVNNGNDVMTVQELLRHARITLEIYAQALGETKREAQGQIYRMLQDGGVKSLALPSVCHVSNHKPL
jgi:site-specific recombinase XerD